MLSVNVYFETKHACSKATIQKRPDMVRVQHAGFEVSDRARQPQQERKRKLVRLVGKQDILPMRLQPRPGRQRRLGIALQADDAGPVTLAGIKIMEIKRHGFDTTRAQVLHDLYDSLQFNLL